MVQFELTKAGVILEYTAERNVGWVRNELKTNGEVTVSRAFTFASDDLLKGTKGENENDPDYEVFRFDFASRENGYFRIKGRKLGVENDVLIAERGIKLERKLFVAERNVRIFTRIAKVMPTAREIAIGGDREGAIPIKAFRELIARFPNSLELDRYASARVEAIIGDFADEPFSARDSYERYLAKRKPVVRDAPLPQYEILDAEVAKFEFLRDTIVDWLAKDKGTYSEKDWQTLILKVILLILPKYVAVLENVQIPDSYTTPGKTTKRFIDICLVDAGGNVDVIEIKRPFDNALLSRGLYRDNSVPTRELSGCIMQVEKYLFHLSKWGVSGERTLTTRYQKKLPRPMDIRITNPKAMLIIGRDRLPAGEAALSPRQAFDLEVIKRKYANVIDILTYDDLLRRLDNIIASLMKRRDAA